MVAGKRTTGILAALILFIFSTISVAMDKGIYVTQSSLENTPKLRYLIDRSKQAGINTFIVDLHRVSKRYNQNIQHVHNNGIRYVARVVVFPHGGNHAQVNSQQYWEKRNRLVQHAIRLGAHAIQLDYIRYHTGVGSYKQNVEDIHRVIRYFKDRTAEHNVPLEIDVFGETSFKPSYRIGQDVRAFANTVDAVNPMVYPSHYAPHRYHTDRPYQTVYKSLQAMKAQFDGQPPFRINAYIEATNFRNPGYGQQKMDYLREQIRAAEDSGVDGWYVWSARNKYDHLFRLLSQNN